MKMQTDLTAEHLRAVLDYNPETGEFRWKRRPDYPASWNTRRAGKIAGGKLVSNGKLYWTIRVDDHAYQAHRLAWLWMLGVWPERTIDHEDGNGQHNWWSNLRAATQQQQVWNRCANHNSKTGLKGIEKRGNSYRVRVVANREAVTRSFTDLEQAKAWHAKMSRALHGSFAHQPKETADDAVSTDGSLPVL